MNMLVDNIKHMLHCGCVVLGIVSVACCQQEINVARLVNGGQCYSSMFLNSWANCNRLIDGDFSGTARSTWVTETNITDQWIHFEFDRPYAIKRVVVYHPYYLDQRNINKVALQFANDLIYELTLSNNREGRGATDTMEIPGIEASSMIMTFINIDMMKNPYYSLQEVEVYGINVTGTTTHSRTPPPTTAPSFNPPVLTPSTILVSSISFSSKVTSSSIPPVATNQDPSPTVTVDYKHTTADAQLKNELEHPCGGSDSLTIGVTVALLCISTIVAHIIIVIVVKKRKDRNTNAREYDNQFLNTISGNGSRGTSNVNMEYEDVSNLPLPSIVVTNNQPTHPRSVKNPIDVNTNAMYEELGMVSGPRPEPQYEALKSNGNI